MKVRCVKTLDSAGHEISRSPWLKLGAVYHVLSIWIEPGRTRFRLVGEEPTPVLFDPEMFEVLTSQIPNTWVIASPAPGYFSIAPQAWNLTGFWERYFQGDTVAVAVFDEERTKIIEADP